MSTEGAAAAPFSSRAGNPFIADGALLAITLLWGVTFVTVKDAMALADPVSFVAMRFALGAAVTALIARRALRSAALWRTGFFLSVFLFLGFIFQTWGLKHTTPSRSAFITGLSMVMVPFASWWLSKRRPKAVAMLGTGIAVAGLFILTNAGTDGSGLNLGDGLTVLCTFAYAMHIALTEKWGPAHAPIALVTAQLTGVALLALLCLPFVDLQVSPSRDLWLAVAITGVLATAVAISIYTWAQARTSAVKAALMFSLEPVFAALYSAGTGREVLGQREYVGGALIIAGVLVAEVGGALLRRSSQPVH
ncbi:MAG: DMT family transporter [Myxococcaceae bacterium]|nr:DMT family transporter [Myxococcaceae bacterium]